MNWIPALPCSTGIAPPCWQQGGNDCNCLPQLGKRLHTCAAGDGVPTSNKLQTMASTIFTLNATMIRFGFSAKHWLAFAVQLLTASHPAENLLTAEMSLIRQSRDKNNARNKIGRRGPLLTPVQIPPPGEQAEQEQRQPTCPAICEWPCPMRRCRRASRTTSR